MEEYRTLFDVQRRAVEADAQPSMYNNGIENETVGESSWQMKVALKIKVNSDYLSEFEN